MSMESGEKLFLSAFCRLLTDFIVLSPLWSHLTTLPPTIWISSLLTIILSLLYLYSTQRKVKFL